MNLTATEMLKHLAANELTAYEITQSCLQKIKDSTHLNAVIQINPDALAIARNLDQNPSRGPLHGIPVLIKDNISTSDQMKTSAGSVALADNKATADAPIVQGLREAGAVILGKTNLTEFSNYMTDGEMPNGYSSQGGQTVSTFGPQHDTSGSSSGSAVAIAASFAPLSIGTETCGSIISPAQNAGILGLKPTRGAVPNAGIIPISHTLDTAGPMAKTAADLKMLFEVLANKTLLLPETLNGFNIGIIRHVKDINNSVGTNEKLEAAVKALAKKQEKYAEAYEQVIEKLQGAGANMVELEPHGINSSAIYPITFHEFKYALNAHLEEYGDTKQNTLAKIVAYNETHAEIALKYGQNLLVRAEKETLGELSEGAYLEALDMQKEAKSQLDRLFEENHLDVIFSMPLDIELAAFTGNPSLTVPMGGDEPFGAFFMGKDFGEDLLIKIAEVLG